VPRRLGPLLLALAAAAPLALPATSSAQTRSVPSVTMRVRSVSSWTGPGRALRVVVEARNEGAAPLERLSVRLTIRDRVRSRSALRAALEGRAGGGVIAVTTEDLGRRLARGEAVEISVERDLSSLAAAFRPDRGRSGVYPLEIELQAEERTLAERSTAFVFLAAPPVASLNVVWVLPLHLPPLRDPQGVFDLPTVRAELSSEGRIGGLADLLAARSGAPLTLAPTGLFLDELADLADGFVAREGGSLESVPATDPLAQAAAAAIARLRAAASGAGSEVAATPYARADLSSLAAADLLADAGRQLRVGAARVAQELGRQPTVALLAPGAYRADVRSARTLGAFGARTLILDPASLRDRPDGRFGPDRPEEVTAPGISFTALLVDPPIRARLGAPEEDPSLAAQGVVAETAAASFELPALAAGRLLVIASDEAPDPAIAGPLLDALSEAPWVRLRTASDVAADPELRPEGEPLPLAAARARVDDRLQQARIARAAVETLAQIVAASAEEATAPLDRLVLTAESADFEGRPAAGSAYARAARGRAERTLERVSVASRRVTLTARAGEVPVTILNRTGLAIRLRVRLVSAKLQFPRGAERLVALEGPVTTVTFAVQARTAGSFPATVVLETPDGSRVIGRGQVVVRSTAVSALTLAATGGGAIFLLGAWARRARARRSGATRPG
jgi:hypothetical protein